MCDVVIGCHDFAQRLCGIKEARAALERLSEMGPLWAGRTMGPEGSEMYVRGRYFRQPAFKVDAIDTTGAGDAFHAGMAHAVLLGQGPREALATASALAAISVTGLGGRNALPDRPALEAFIRDRRV